MKETNALKVRTNVKTARKCWLFILLMVCGIGAAGAGAADLPPKQLKPETEYAPGELIVKVAEGASIDDLQELNASYQAEVTGQVFAGIPGPEDTLNGLEEKLEKLNAKYVSHTSWFWYMNQNSPEYKEYKARQQKLQKQIQQQKEFIAGIREKQKRNRPADIKDMRLEDIYLLKISSTRSLIDAVNAYKTHPSVEYAEPNYLNKLHKLPNDHFLNTSEPSWGQDYADLWGVKILQAPEAWELFSQAGSQGYELAGQGAVVAVVDTGVDYRHGDIADNILRYPDNTVYGIDYSGDDVVEFESSAVRDNDPMDGDGHGTHISGTIAAVGNNDKGIIGIAPRAKIMPVKIFPNAYDSIAAKGIVFAALNGADIINCSWGEDVRRPISKTLENAVYTAHWFYGSLVVFAAGNENDDIDYHSPQNMSEVVAVGAIGPDKKRSYFSSWGNNLAVCAPGGGLPDWTHVQSQESSGGAYIFNRNNATLWFNLDEGTSSLTVYLPRGPKGGIIKVQVLDVIKALNGEEDYAGETIDTYSPMPEYNAPFTLNFPPLPKGHPAALLTLENQDGKELAFDCVIINGKKYEEDDERIVKDDNFRNMASILSLKCSSPDSYYDDFVLAEDYLRLIGTSMAAPHVCGVAALIKSKNPALNNNQIRYILTHTAEDLGEPGKDEEYGYGLVNAQAAVLAASEPHETIHTQATVHITAPSFLAIKEGTADFMIEALSFKEILIEYALCDIKTGTPVETGWHQLYHEPYRGQSYLLPTLNTSGMADGLYAVRATVIDEDGNKARDTNYFILTNHLRPSYDILYDSGGYSDWYPGGGRRDYSTESAMAGDFDGNPDNGVEAVFHTGYGHFDMAKFRTESKLFMVNFNTGKRVFWTLGDLDSNVAMGRLNPDSKEQQMVIVLNGYLYVLASFKDKVPGWKRQYKDIDFDTSGGSGQITIADLDSDGKNEILCAMNTKLYILRNDGTAFLPNVPVGSGIEFVKKFTILSQPVAADLDPACPGLEIVFGSSSEDGWVFSGDYFELFAVHSDGTLFWKKNFGSRGEITRPVVIANIDNSKDGSLEIICATRDGQLRVFTAGGQEFPGKWPVSFTADGDFRNAWGGISVADLDGNGTLEIVTSFSSADAAKVAVLRCNGEPLNDKWPKKIEGGQIRSCAALGDIDNDGTTEILLGSDNHNLYAWKPSGEDVSGFPFPTLGRVTSPVIADLEGDKKIDILCAALGEPEHNIATGKSFVYVLGKNNSGSFTEPQWPMPQKNPARNCALLPGDVNADGSVTGEDIQLAWRAMRGDKTLAAGQKKRADLNQDGNITREDYLRINQIFRKIRPYVREPDA